MIVSVFDIDIVQFLSRIAVQIKELLIEGSPENLVVFTSYLGFSPDARPSNHTHFEYWTGNERVSPQSIPLIIGIRQQREKDVVDADARVAGDECVTV